MTMIRPARETDLPDILDIYNHVILHTTAVYSYRPHTLDMRKAWYDDKVRDGYPIFVAEDAGRVVGSRGGEGSRGASRGASSQSACSV